MWDYTAYIAELENRLTKSDKIILDQANTVLEQKVLIRALRERLIQKSIWHRFAIWMKWKGY